MIIVVEGISAAGKTTYSRQFGDEHWLPELPVKDERPDAGAPTEDHTRFWAEHNIMRFQKALEIERQHGFAICDTDPMKIHYPWCIERAGFDWPDKFAIARHAVRQALADRRIGFADRYFVKNIDPAVARAQKEGDATRRRGNFEQHLALQPHLMDWFTALSKTLPDRVEFAFPDHQTVLSQLKNKTPETNPRRFDVSVFDALEEHLPT
ncbi:hypothetical protein [Pontixanthobacter sp. CEM42]|uniref:hypothetical protein n=1 Tax=Pontixanthobacter sp. CEM42 TaxID=2792077 RepID=UPI001ADF0E99|nr:hypothetical protein [Pontixanthobacter sp. CEM42]